MNQDRADQAEGGGTEEKSRFVLRMVRLKNFVNFHKEQKLEFKENGAYYLIGANQSGKSSIFEAIRRCLSLKNNSSLSSAAKGNEESVVVCKYEDNTENASCSQKPILYTFYIRVVGRLSCFKGCVLLKDEKPIIGLDHVKLNNDEMVCLDISPKSDQTHVVGNIFTREAMEQDENLLNSVIEWVKTCERLDNIPPSNCERLDDSRLSTCEKLLQEHLDTVEFTMSMRGIGPLQWTKSLRLKHRSSNYTDASDNAEIIKWYLEELENGKVDEDVKVKEQDIFNFITNSRGGEFTLKQGESGAKSIIVNDTMPILKQSEGFIEAKICSILLAEKTFTTIGLEDPGTGMHIQMIERLRTVLTSVVKDKVVIITTHFPHFVKPGLLRNIFFLARNDKNMCEITAGETISECKELMSAVPASISPDAFATLCFIETPIFVEGESDVQFMEAFMEAIKISESDAHFCALHFFSISGKDKAKHFVEYCKALHKKYYFMLDMDPTFRVRNAIESSIKEGRAFFLKFDSIENVFLHRTGILGTLKNKKTKLCIRMKDILNKCFRTKITISEQNVIENIQEPGSYKLFLHGKETFDERVELFRFITDDVNIKKALKDCVGRHDLVDLCGFMNKIPP